MKNLKSRKVSYSFIVAMLFISVSLSAQQMRRGGGENHPPQMEQERGEKGMSHGKHRRPHIPNLTEEQKEQLHSWKVEADKIALPLENQIGEKEAQLTTLTTSEQFDQGAVENLIDEIGSIKTELKKLQVSQIQKVKSILTEEQLVAFNKQLAQAPRKAHRRG